MSGSGKADNGRGNSRRHQFRRRNNNDEGFDSLHGNSSVRAYQKPQEKKQAALRASPQECRRNEKPHVERPKWTPQRMNTNPLPVPDCPFCGKPIRDISQAIADKDTGIPVHFDCVINRINVGEILEKDDSVTYIGGGRFGVVSFSARNEFKIKRIIEWENKDKRAEWRSEICEHYSVV